MLDTDAFHDALAALEWQVDLGVDEAIQDTPVNRYEEQPVAPKKVAAQPDHGPAVQTTDPVAVAKAAAGASADLNGLRAAMSAFEECDLKRGARNLVFSDGNPGARVMIVGEAPGRDEDIAGKPFVGRAGQLLDRMFGAIGLSRGDGSLYITNVLPWRPPQNRDPSAEEIAMMRPFLHRHIQIAAPDVLIVMGNISADALLGRRGITRMRGKWAEVQGRPALPMVHPAYLLRNPVAKREAWADLLALKDRLD
ncbi:uracil-DNA glycosylase [Palleronia abyssalis]|uniref:Type-4 uracil-DNA glycosylase n=1 Tax=Palleronia abyssalis TaxID=1501240 RepID=A0A2R8BWZ3_9RHOB|nr:uracil-DNA glycosylase [Palleronia abyssalis]SPJ24681.1 hypothetical protein PAA8504_02518 [Palleronia abyssalis]